MTPASLARAKPIACGWNSTACAEMVMVMLEKNHLEIAGLMDRWLQGKPR